MLIYAKPYLKECIIRSGNSVASFAEQIGLTRQAMYLMLNRRNGIRPTNTKKVLELLNKDFDEVFEIVELEDK